MRAAAVVSWMQVCECSKIRPIGAVVDLTKCDSLPLVSGLRRSRSSGIIAHMIIGDRLRALRVEKNLSQGDFEKRTGLFRCYISRVENGHTVPTIETLEKMARALDIPLYLLFYGGEEPPKLTNRKSGDKNLWGNSGKEYRALHNFRRLLGQVKEKDQRLLLCLPNQMALRKTSKSRGQAK
jgi:transcriptional regulator with XRE-family HTH domain